MKEIIFIYCFSLIFFLRGVRSNAGCKHSKFEVCVQLLTYADSMALPAFDLRLPLLLSVSQQSPTGLAAGLLLWAPAWTDRQTSGRPIGA